MLAALMALSFSAAHADWKDSYRGYQAAAAVGDLGEAERYARDAWLGARKVLPPGETLAILAQNYAELAVSSNPEAAVAPLEEALSLGREGFGNGNLAVLTLEFMLAEVRSANAPEKKRLALKAIDAVDTIPKGERLFTSIIKQRSRLAWTLKEQERFARMARLAGALSDELAARGNTPASLALGVETLRGIALANGQSRRMLDDEYLDLLARSAGRFMDIAADFPSAESLSKIPPEKLTAHLWRSFLYTYWTASADGATMPNKSTRNFSPLLSKDLGCSRVDFIRSGVIGEGFYLPGHNGSVAIGFELERTGRVSSVKILDQIPNSKYAEEIIREARFWTIDVSDVPDRCLGEQVMIVSIHRSG
ncbi:hypothetical protein HK107_01275 [Parvularcula sp. ZS-1/3]|uniref:Uncharacterized protein n=1 Tax=Parvularcula mediterranea TaxID=2732508 RepID=A0A7Y3RIZ3_9PROT|nr:hypothetical protein [Parvularcula mediterranea]NNU14953.1 hypothetical protein [Parvularcula mediterranea]